MPKPRARSVVVGAGLPGIVASFILARTGREVLLLDSAPSIGGLLRSYDVAGFSFDYGTHFANKTGIEDLDDFLFGGFESEWREFPFLKAGNFWNGKLNEVSENPDLNALGREKHNRCLLEVLVAQGWRGGSVADNAREFLVSEYGPYLVEVFFDPVLRKFTGLSSESLHHQVNLLFNLRRFAVLDCHATSELKRSSCYDRKISFHHRDNFKGHRPSLYPRVGGIGNWIEQLETKMHQYGIKVVLDAKIERISISMDKVDKLVFNSKEIPLDELVWGVAPAAFLNLARIKADCRKPSARATVLVGLEMNRPLETTCYFFTVFDDTFKSFRTTVYDNFRCAPTRRHAVTVEFMVDPCEVGSFDWSRLAESELRGMGVLSSSTKIVGSHKKVVANGFPVQTNTSVDALANQSSVIKEFKNVGLVGRGNGKGWFLDGLLRDAYETAVKLVNQ